MHDCSPSRRPWLSLLLACVAAVGCQNQDKITVSSSPRRTEPRTADDAKLAAAALSHMVVAVIPQGEAAWFFKLEGTPAQLDQVRTPWNALLASIELPNDVPDRNAQAGQSGPPADAAKLPTWKLPEGWRQLPGDGMRNATLEIPVENGELQISVTRLPMNASFDAYLTQNVNRWLDQLGQEPLPEATVVKLVKRHTFGGSPSAVVELRGRRQTPGGALPAGHPPVDASQAKATGPSAKPEGAKENAAAQPDSKPHGAGVAQDAAIPFQYKLPEGWKSVPSNPPRIATFVANAAQAIPSVTLVVTSFGVSGSMADPLVNAERWAGMVGRRDLERTQLEKLIEPIEIAGIAGQRFALSGSDDDPLSPAIRVGMVQREGMVWFFKMSGPSGEIKAESEAFDALLSSIRFP